jgi:DNA-directed RNA polymerase delta subunit
MNSQNRYIKKFAKPDPRVVTQIAFEKVLDEKYSSMSFDDVVAELEYMTVRDRTELSAQTANLYRSYNLKRIGRFISRHDKPKFMAMYREWKSQQPILPL